MNHLTLRARALARPDVKAEFERLKPEFEFLDQVLAARKAANLTQVLGHSTIRMTERYAHNAPENSRAAVERLNALSQSGHSTDAKR